jgi:hypothetical protein
MSMLFEEGWEKRRYCGALQSASRGLSTLFKAWGVGCGGEVYGDADELLFRGQGVHNYFLTKQRGVTRPKLM